MLKIFKKIDVKKILLLLVFIEHLLCFYFNNVINKDNLLDAVEFYSRSLEIDIIRDLPYLLMMGSRFMLLVTALFSGFIQDFFVISFIFSLIGFIPYYFIINKYYEKIFSQRNLFLKITFILLLFIPSVHIWVTSIFKEALIFPLMYFLLQSIDKITKGNIFRFDMLVCFLLLFCVRPYLACIFLLSYIIANYRFLNKKVLIMLLIFSALFAFFFVKLMLPTLDVFNIGNTISGLNEYSKAVGSSSIDLNTNYLQRLIYMLFRPMFFDAATNVQFIYSFENLIFAAWFLLFLYTLIKNKIKVKFLFQNIFIVTSILIWLFIGIYIYNYGLASRMKVMILPFIFIGAIGILKPQYHEKNS